MDFWYPPLSPHLSPLEQLDIVIALLFITSIYSFRLSVFNVMIRCVCGSLNSSNYKMLGQACCVLITHTPLFSCSNFFLPVVGVQLESSGTKSMRSGPILRKLCKERNRNKQSNRRKASGFTPRCLFFHSDGFKARLEIFGTNITIWQPKSCCCEFLTSLGVLEYSLICNAKKSLNHSYKKHAETTP